MYVVCVTVQVKPGKADEFIAATLANARNSRGEPGNARFDLLRAEDDTNRFFLYEAYRRKEDFAAHQMADHYLAWRETVVELMAAPRVGLKHYNIFPEDGQW